MSTEKTKNKKQKQVSTFQIYNFVLSPQKVFTPSNGGGFYTFYQSFRYCSEYSIFLHTYNVPGTLLSTFHTEANIIYILQISKLK